MNDGHSNLTLSDSTHSSLLFRLKANDQGAWRIAVHLYEPLIHYWFRQSNLPHDDWADVLQDIFRSVSQNIVAFQHDEDSHTFRGWLHTITRHKVADHFRKVRQDQLAQGGSDAHRFLQEIPARHKAPGDPAEDRRLPTACCCAPWRS